MINKQQYSSPKLRREKTSIKKRIAHRAQQLLYLSGIANMYASLHKNDWGLILMYHAVVGEDIAPFIDPENSITVKQFEFQLALLQKSYKVTSLTELLICLRDKRPILPKTVVITFDDGYLDNLVNAAPLLAKYRLPATLFLATRYIELAEPQWIDRLYTSFQFRSRQKLSLKRSIESFDLRDKLQLKQAHTITKETLRISGFQKRKALLENIEEQLEPSVSPPHLTLNWDDVRLLKDKFPLFDIGIHTQNHQDLTLLEDKQAVHEIRQSQQDYENELGCQARLFSYPYGRHNLGNRTYIKKTGFLGAVGTQPTYRITKLIDRYALPRLSTSRSLLDLKVWLTGAFPELSISLWGKASE